MKDFLGMVLAALLDFRWFLGAIIFGGLLTFGCANIKAQEIGGSITEPDDKAHDHALIATMSGKDSQMAIQEGSFNCKPDQHRAILLVKNNFIFVGCATVSKEGILIEWENGQTVHFSPGSIKHEHEHEPEIPGGHIPRGFDS